MKNFIKGILKAVGIFMIFLLVVVVIISSLSNGVDFAANTLGRMIRISIEVLILTLIATLFFRKQPKSLYPLIIGITLTAIWYSTGIFSQIQLFKSYEGIAAMTNVSADFAYFVSNAQQQVSGGLFTYIGNWLLRESGFMPLLLTSIFFINYRKCQLNSLSWGKTLWNITKAFFPIAAIIAYTVAIILIFPNAETQGRSIIFFWSVLLFTDIYLAIRLRRKVIEKQKEEIKIKKSKYKIIPVVIFSIICLLNIYQIFMTPFPLVLIYIFILIALSMSEIFIFLKPTLGSIIGICSAVIYGGERLITSLYQSDDIFSVVMFFSSILITVGLVLLLVNVLLTYKESRVVTKEKTLKELWLKKKGSPEEESNKAKKNINSLSLWQWISIGLSVIVFVLAGFFIYWSKVHSTKETTDMEQSSQEETQNGNKDSSVIVDREDLEKTKNIGDTANFGNIEIQLLEEKKLDTLPATDGERYSFFAKEKRYVIGLKFSVTNISDSNQTFNRRSGKVATEDNPYQAVEEFPFADIKYLRELGETYSDENRDLLVKPNETKTTWLVIEVETYLTNALFVYSSGDLSSIWAIN